MVALGGIPCIKCKTPVYPRRVRGRFVALCWRTTCVVPRRKRKQKLATGPVCTVCGLPFVLRAGARWRHACYREGCVAEMQRRRHARYKGYSGGTCAACGGVRHVGTTCVEAQERRMGA